jgi:hypothetical protein
VSAKGVWLQAVFAFARDIGQISNDRFADAAIKLAWRRHSHVTIDPSTLLSALESDNTDDLIHFAKLTAFIGTKSAEMRSHVEVSRTFLDSIWIDADTINLKTMKSTSILLDRLISNRQKDWAILLAFLKRKGAGDLPSYIDKWIRGHFLPLAEFKQAETDIDVIAADAASRYVAFPGDSGKSGKRRGTGRQRRR